MTEKIINHEVIDGTHHIYFELEDFGAVAMNFELKEGIDALSQDSIDQYNTRAIEKGLDGWEEYKAIPITPAEYRKQHKRNMQGGDAE